MYVLLALLLLTEEPIVTFTSPSEAVIQIHGKKIKVDTARQIWTVDDPASPTPLAARQQETTSQDISQQQAQKGAEPKDENEEPSYGYELVNLPTPRRFEKNSLAIHFTHRFTQPFFTKDSPPDLFGLDSFSYSGFGLSYGITDRLYARAYRTPLERNVELLLGLNLLRQGKRIPLDAAAYFSVEGRDNFSERYTANIGFQLAHSIKQYGSIHFSPIISLNSNVDEPAVIFSSSSPPNQGEADNHTVAFGLGGQLNFRPTASLIFEYIPRVGYKPQPDATISFGIQKRTYRHIFTLTFSNTQQTTSSRMNSGFGNFGDLRKGLTIGFNIYRRFF
ncbi:MAG: DUF5777 family beta-barrel protein [Acidobacteriota bacterium]|nr:DUF5777 family beta-barrel protein [Blastocatellia bacterium]MDW8411929.1 DUF5777 family beta-barrel protein [Acidobacteriota bacterium]